ncbi:ATP-binding protein [Candidatus Woesearchaeota archaeon]|nr:ATP-binding protein [Candidatus Woesearchaeota archaeon]
MARTSLDDKVSEFDVRVEAGDDLLDTISRLLSKDVLTDFSELVANAYDADAPHVDVTYNPERDLIVISDNGDGMDENGIRGFFRMGQSIKKTQPVSPKGRRRVGSYGLATKSLMALSGNYSLETFNGGFFYTVDVDSGSKKPLKVKFRKAPPGKKGTTITMHDLKFLKDGRVFTADDLRRKLAVEMPLSGEFTVNVNGEPVVLKKLENAVEYAIDYVDPVVGKMVGSLFYNPRPIGDDAGVYIKVDGRAVGGPNLDLFGERFSVGLARRLFGVVHVEGLRDLITLDRRSFLRDHPKFKTVTDYIFQILRNVRQDMEMDLQIRKRNRTENRLDERIVSSVGRSVRDILKEEGAPYDILFDAERAGEVARIDVNDRKLYINPRSPVCGLKGVSPKDVKGALLDAAVFAATQNSLPEKGGAREKYENLVLRAAKLVSGSNKISLAELLGEIKSGDGDRVDYYRISPNRLYTYKEVTRATGWENTLVKRLVESGVLTNRSGDRIFGSEISSIVEKLSGSLPMYSAVRRAFPKPDTKDPAPWYYNAESNATENLDALLKGYAAKPMGSSGGQRARLKSPAIIPPYLRNLAAEGRTSFWVVDETHIDLFRNFMLTCELKDIGTLSQPIYSYLRFSREGGVIFYALQVEGKMAPDVIRSTIKNRFKFIEEEEGEGIPLGIRTKSSCAIYLGKKYVFGVYAGDESSVVFELPKKFNANGFKNVDMPSSLAKPLFSEVVGQVSRSMPPAITENFKDKYSGVLAHMLGIKIEKESRRRGKTPHSEQPVGVSADDGVEGAAEDPEEIEERDLEAKARRTTGGPPETTNSFFASRTYTHCSVGGNGILAYLLEVRDPKETRGIKSAVAKEVGFAYTGRSDGVRSSSYLSKHGGKTYVLGFFTGKVGDLQDEFHAAGFDMVNYDNGKAAFAVLVTSRNQKLLNLPLRNLDDFDKTMKNYVVALASK